MKRILSSVLAVGICMTPVTVTLMAQPGWGQSQESQAQKLRRLIQQGVQQTEGGQPLQAIETFQQVLAIARQVPDRELESVALLAIGRNYHIISKHKQALAFYNQALPIFRELGDRNGVAGTFNNIGLVYSEIGKAQQALDYFNQALLIRREVSDRSGEAATLNNIAALYSDIGKARNQVSG